MNANPIRIFIADDSPTVVAVIKSLLAKTTDMVVIGDTDSGISVVEQAKQLKPDLILMDISLARGTDGITASRRIKTSLPAIKIIIITSHDDEQLLFDAFSAGADGFFLKGAFNELFVRAIRSVHAGAAWLHPAIAGKVLRACATGAARLADMKRRTTAEYDLLASRTRHISLRHMVGICSELISQRRDAEAESALAAAVALAEKLAGAADPEYAALLTLQADFYYEREKFIQAEQLYLKALEIRHQVLGAEHLDVAKSLENLGNLYDTKSSYAEAEHYYFWSLKILEKTGGPESPLSKETCAKLAWVYRAQGKLDLARDMENRARKPMSSLKN